MNFPDYPLFEFFYWLVNTPGLGGIIALFLGVASISSALLTLRWIQRGGSTQNVETYVYPTPALHHHEGD